MRRPFWEVLKNHGLSIPRRFKPQPGEHPLISFNNLAKIYADALPEDWAFVKDSNGELYCLPPEISTVLTCFNSGSQPVFKIARHFGEQLAKVDLQLSVNFLQSTGGFVWIEFPDNLRFEMPYTDGKYYGENALVWVVVQEGGPGALEFKLHRDGGELQAYIYICSPLFFKNGGHTLEWDSIKIAVSKENPSIDYALNAAMFNHLGSEKIGKIGPEAAKHYQYVLKALLYIMSGEPDLRAYRPPKTDTKNPKKIRQFLRQHAEEPMIPMTLVGYDFKKPAEYRVGETSVTGHFRWQPYGEGRTKVKLIWIDEHLRHYKKTETPDGND